jgi:hypothetical protein
MWITWRRYRVRIVLFALYALALIVLMIVTEHGFRGVLTSCNHHEVVAFQDRACRSAASRAEGRDGVAVLGIALVPILIGLVFGAPLVASEFEAKTNRLAWAQGVTRTRWLLVSWSTLAVATVVMMSILAVFAHWWAADVFGIVVTGSGLFISTENTGVVLVAMAIFSLSFGTSMGALFRSFSMSVAGTLIGLLVIVTAISDSIGGPHALHQWEEAGIYLLLAATSLGLSVWRVRRWRA